MADHIKSITEKIKSVEKENAECKQKIEDKQLKVHIICNTCFNCSFCKMPEYACANPICPQ